MQLLDIITTESNNYTFFILVFRTTQRQRQFVTIRTV